MTQVTDRRTFTLQLYDRPAPTRSKVYSARDYEVTIGGVQHTFDVMEVKYAPHHETGQRQAIRPRPMTGKVPGTYTMSATLKLDAAAMKAMQEALAKLGKDEDP